MATQRKYLDYQVELEIQDQVNKGLSPSQIHQAVAAKYGEEAVTIRTVQRRYNKLRPRDPSGPWDWRQGGVENMRGVLNVLQTVVRMTEGRKTGFTNREAALIDKVLDAAPGLQLWSVYLLVRWVMRAEAEETHIQEVDGLMIFQPWKDGSHKQQYRRAVENGWVPSLPDIDYILNMAEMLAKEGQS